MNLLSYFINIFECMIDFVNINKYILRICTLASLVALLDSSNQQESIYELQVYIKFNWNNPVARRSLIDNMM